jgi:Cu-Zn family superoxide dismutase
MNRSTVTASVATAALAGTAALALAAPALADVARASGEVTRYPGQSPAADAPAGASARVQSVATGDGKTIVTLHVTGFEGLKQYGAHAHTQPCGATGGAAGPHFQLRQDLATDPAGEGRAKAVVDWQFPSDRRAKSVIIHERATSTSPGVAGTAGKRVACLTVAF